MIHYCWDSLVRECLQSRHEYRIHCFPSASLIGYLLYWYFFRLFEDQETQDIAHEEEVMDQRVVPAPVNDLIQVSFQANSLQHHETLICRGLSS